MILTTAQKSFKISALIKGIFLLLYCYHYCCDGNKKSSTQFNKASDYRKVRSMDPCQITTECQIVWLRHFVYIMAPHILFSSKSNLNMDHMDKRIKNGKKKLPYNWDKVWLIYHSEMWQIRIINSLWRPASPVEETLVTAFHDFLMLASQLYPLLAKSCVTIL